MTASARTLLVGVPDELSLERLRCHRDFISLDGDLLMMLVGLAAVGMNMHMENHAGAARMLDMCDLLRERLGKRATEVPDTIVRLTQRLEAIARGQPVAAQA